MAIYFVDGDNGSDTNNGTSPETAWKTIGKACSTLVAGDKVYIKPGTYREQMNPANAGSSGNEIQYVGDINGEYFGVKGFVKVTNLNADTDIWCTRDRALSHLSNRPYYIYRNILFEGASKNGENTQVIALLSSYVTFENCIIYKRDVAQSSFYLAGIILSWEGNTTNYTFKNCIFIGNYQNENTSNTFNALVYFNNSSSGSLTWIFENCLFMNSYKAIGMDYPISPLYIKNCIFWNVWCAIHSTTNYFGYWDHLNLYNNLFKDVYYTTNNSSNVIEGQGGNYKEGVRMIYPSTLVLNQITAPILNISSMYEVLKDFARTLSGKGTSGGTTYDFMNNPRPLNDGYDVGCAEWNPSPTKENSIVRSGNASLKISKAGYVDKVVWLSSGSHTISVYTKWSGYSGTNKPQLIIKQDNYCGISSDQVATAIGDGSNWEQLSVNITLTKDALVEYRLYARDTGSSAVTYFDDDNVT